MNTNITYTKAMDRLNEIMQLRESGALDVDALTDTLKEARGLLAFCKDKLYAVDKSIQEIMESSKSDTSTPTSSAESSEVR